MSSALFWHKTGDHEVLDGLEGVRVSSAALGEQLRGEDPVGRQESLLERVLRMC